MKWVKLWTRYYASKELALGSDAQEVMFTRGLALAGELEESGFIPDAMLHHLTRKPAQARRLASGLVKADLWERVLGGYLIVNWDEYQDSLEKEVDRRRRDRDRKRRKRAEQRSSSGAVSAPVSADSPADGPLDSLLDHQRKEVDAAAAAAAPAQLDPTIDVFRAKLQAHTRLQALRFDTLGPKQSQLLVALIEKHGDDRLVKVALDTCKATPPVHVSAFLGTWEALPEPGRRLAVVEQQFCVTHPWQRRTTGGVCTACASEQIAEGANA